MRRPAFRVCVTAGVCALLTVAGYSAGSRFAATAHRDKENSGRSSIETQVDALTERIDRLNEENTALRIAVGLTPLPSDVYAVGIGGREAPWPDAVTPELDTWARLDRLSRGVKLLHTSYQQVESRIREDQEVLSRIPSINPVPDGVVNSRFGVRLHPIFGVKAMHEGMDFAAPRDTPVLATADGVVSFSGKYGGYGNLIEIDHGNGLTTRYAHNRTNSVRLGQRVTRGQAIASVGATGITTSPHLHYEVRRDGVAVDPQPYVLPGVIVD
ncbi:M23 family metallopeptidase [Candidatus Fermentibacteria bacterium]|nr:M23 family metallopeptidase [Candidatus Fermentibacteria bacterium]